MKESQQKSRRTTEKETEAKEEKTCETPKGGGSARGLQWVGDSRNQRVLESQSSLSPAPNLVWGLVRGIAESGPQQQNYTAVHGAGHSWSVVPYMHPHPHPHPHPTKPSPTPTTHTNTHKLRSAALLC